MSTTQRVPDYPPTDDHGDAHGSVAASSAYADHPGGEAPEHPLGPIRAILRRWWIVLIVLAVFLGGGVYAASKQAPTYSSAGQFNVGRTDVRVQALPGYVDGAIGLATAYSRIATTDQIVLPLVKQTGLSKAQVRKNLQVFPVAGSPIFTVQGSAESPAEAMAFTRAAMAQIQRYVTRSDAGTTPLATLLSGYRRQAREVASIQRRIDAATAKRASVRAGGTGTAPSLASIDNLKASRDAAQLQLNTLQSQYQDRSGEVTSTAGLQAISRPTTTFDNKRQTLQRLLAVGLVGGLLVGSVLALLYDRRRTR